MAGRDSTAEREVAERPAPSCVRCASGEFVTHEEASIPPAGGARAPAQHALPRNRPGVHSDRPAAANA